MDKLINCGDKITKILLFIACTFILIEVFVHVL